MEFTEEAVFARYKELCAQRDKVYEMTAPIEELLAKANEESDLARQRALALGKQIDDIYGPDWLKLKKEIAQLARFLSKPNGLLAS